MENEVRRLLRGLVYKNKTKVSPSFRYTLLVLSGCIKFSCIALSALNFCFVNPDDDAK